MLGSDWTADDRRELEALRAVKVAAVEVVDEWMSQGGQLLLAQKMEALQLALSNTQPDLVRPPVVWDVDPRKHFGRLAGKLVATITEEQPGSWSVVTDTNRVWPKYRTAEAAQRAVEQSMTRQTALARFAAGRPSDCLRFNPTRGCTWICDEQKYGRYTPYATMSAKHCDGGKWWTVTRYHDKKWVDCGDLETAQKIVREWYDEEHGWTTP